MPKLSVIVPIYNIEDYLGFCLDSILAQTFKDIEVLCVNDGSTDGSRDIAARYAENDARFVIIDKPNGGLSSARNAGIKAASAPCVCFVDSDDSFTSDACEKIVAAFKRTTADVVTFGADFYPASAGNEWLIKHLSPRDIEYKGFSPDLIFKEMSRPFVWRTACRRGFLIDNGLYFDEGLLFGEDQVFHFAIYPRSSKTVLLSDKLYEYRLVREGSLMQQIGNDPERIIGEHITIIEHVLADWSSAGFLSKCPEEMLDWTVEFVLYRIAMRLNPQRNELFERFRNVVLRFFSEQEIHDLKLPWVPKNMIEAALFKPEDFDGKRGKLLRHSCNTYLHGFRAEVRDLFSRTNG